MFLLSFTPKNDFDNLPEPIQVETTAAHGCKHAPHPNITGRRYVDRLVPSEPAQSNTPHTPNSRTRTLARTHKRLGGEYDERRREHQRRGEHHERHAPESARQELRRNVQLPPPRRQRRNVWRQHLHSRKPHQPCIRDPTPEELSDSRENSRPSNIAAPPPRIRITSPRKYVETRRRLRLLFLLLLLLLLLLLRTRCQRLRRHHVSGT